MTVVSCRITLYLPDSHSLKEKRSVIQGLLRRLRARHNISAVETDGRDLWQKAVLAVALAAEDSREAETRLQRVLRDVEEITALKHVEFEPQYYGRG